jgi:neutral trehalase
MIMESHSCWIIEGLLRSKLFDVTNSTLQDFMDEIEHFSLILNGARIYCTYALPALISLSFVQS